MKWLVPVAMAFVVMAACGKGDSDSSAKAGAGESNPFADRVAYLNEYIGVIEAAGGDRAKAAKDGEAWLSKNTSRIKETCGRVDEYAADLKKGEMATGYRPDLNTMVKKLRVALKAEGKFDGTTLREIGPVLRQFSYFFSCDQLKLPEK